MAPEELSGRVETARHGSRAEVTVPVHSGQLPRHLTTVPTVVGEHPHPHLPLQARGAPDGAQATLARGAGGGSYGPPPGLPGPPIYSPATNRVSKEVGVENGAGWQPRPRHAAGL